MMQQKKVIAVNCFIGVSVGWIYEPALLLDFAGFNLDSAVAIDRKREAQPFRSQVDGFVPLSRHRSAVLRADVELDRNELREPKKTLKLRVGRLRCSRIAPRFRPF
jgi:hypothetical protein